MYFRVKQKLVQFILLILVLSNYTFSYSINQDADIVNLKQGPYYTSERIYREMKQLQQKYSDLLHIVKIGESVDKRDLLVMIMTENVNEYIKKVNEMGLQDALKTLDKVETFVEANIHGRETVAAPTTLKVIETYCKDYYTKNENLKYDVKDILSKAVIHWEVLSNPDGFMISKFGKEGVRNNELKKLIPNSKSIYSKWKANARGVDLNRNFDANYYDLNSKEWVNFWYYKGFGDITEFYKDKPGPYYYRGVNPYSEPETRAMRDYILAHNFKNILSIHNRGEIFYYDKIFMSDTYRDNAKNISKDIANLSGYTPMHLDEKKEWNELGNMKDGFLTDFTVGELNKFTLTIELVPSGARFPLNKKEYFLNAYESLKNIPLYLAILAIKSGDLPFKVYVDGKYFNDYSEEKYAYAAAKRFEGKVIHALGRADGYIPYIPNDENLKKSIETLIDENVIAEKDMYLYKKKMTREHCVEFMVKKLINKKGFDFKFLSYKNLFKDTNNLYVDYARFQNIITGDSITNRFYGDMYMTKEQFAKAFVNFLNVYYDTYMDLGVQLEETIVDKEDISQWAWPQVKFCIKHNILTLDENGEFLPKKHITKKELFEILGSFTEKIQITLQ